MVPEKFKAINCIRNLILRIDINFDNFPKKDIEIKNKIKTVSYEILEIAYEANSTNIKERKIYLLDKLIAKLKIIDFLINLSYEKQIINNKKYIKTGESLSEVLKYVIGWKNSIKI